MRIRRFALTLLLALPLGAQQPRPLTLEEAVRIALNRNPSVRAASESIAVAQARVKQARSAFYPQLSFSGLAKAGLSGTMNGLNPVGLANSPFFDNYATGITAYHPGLDFGRTRHTLEVMRFRSDALEADLDAVEAMVALDAQRAYFDALRAAELETAARRAVESRELNAQQAQAFYEGQLRSKLDLDLARTLLAKAHVELIESRNEVRSAHAALQRALGEEGTSIEYVLTAPEFTPPILEPLDGLVATAEARRPEVLALERSISAAQAAVELARSRRKPMLSFFMTGGWARVTPLVISTLASVGTGLAMPLFTFGKLKGELEEAESYVGYLQSHLDVLRQQIAFETRTTYFELQNALEALPVRELQTTYARQAVDLATVRYQEQLGDVVALNEAESRLAEAEASGIAAVHEVQKLEAELRFVSGLTAQ